MDLKDYWYVDIGDGSKVYHLVRDIKNIAFDTVNTHIIKNSARRKWYAGCVARYKDFIAQAQSNSDTKSLQVASIINYNAGGGKGGNGGGGDNGSEGGGKSKSGSSETNLEPCEDHLHPWRVQEHFPLKSRVLFEVHERY